MMSETHSAHESSSSSGPTGRFSISMSNAAKSKKAKKTDRRLLMEDQEEGSSDHGVASISSSVSYGAVPDHNRPQHHPGEDDELL